MPSEKGRCRVATLMEENILKFQIDCNKLERLYLYNRNAYKKVLYI